MSPLIKPARPTEPPAPPSAFSDRSVPPTAAALETVLGPTQSTWDALNARLELEFAPLTETWSFAGKRHGWSLGIKRAGRPLVYLTPLEGGFRASLALPERSMPTALQADLPEAVRAVVATAPAYPEGRAVRIAVSSRADIEGVMMLIRIRMAS